MFVAQNSLYLLTTVFIGLCPMAQSLGPVSGPESRLNIIDGCQRALIDRALHPVLARWGGLVLLGCGLDVCHRPMAGISCLNVFGRYTIRVVMFITNML